MVGLRPLYLSVIMTC